MHTVTVGISFIVLAGLCNAIFALPMKYARVWQWENTWLVYSTFSLVAFPWLLVVVFVHRAGELFGSFAPAAFVPAIAFGFLWGVAQAGFGVALQLVGISVAMPIVGGVAIVLGAIVPVAVQHPGALLGRLGAVLLLSCILAIGGLVFYSRAVRLREGLRGRISGSDESPLGTPSLASAAVGTDPKAITVRVAAQPVQVVRSRLRGMALSILVGVLAGAINLGFAFSSTIIRQAGSLDNGTMAATFPVWALVMTAGFLPNFCYCGYLLRRRGTGSLFAAVKAGHDFVFSLLMAVVWLSAWLTYGFGSQLIGKFGTSVGYTIRKRNWVGRWRMARRGPSGGTKLMGGSDAYDCIGGRALTFRRVAMD